MDLVSGTIDKGGFKVKYDVTTFNGRKYNKLYSTFRFSSYLIKCKATLIILFKSNYFSKVETISISNKYHILRHNFKLNVARVKASSY